MQDPLLTPEFFQSGAKYAREEAPDPVTLEWLVEKCARLERVLRLQYPEKELPQEWERAIALHKPASSTGAGLRLKSLLEHYYRVRSGNLQARAVEDAGAAEAARALLRREPVVVQLAGERVEVTGRSYSAMMEIAAHDLRGRELDEALARVTAAAARVSAEMDMRPARGASGRRRVLGRRLARLRGIYERLAGERERHRFAIYAHALTEHGGPADIGATEVPEWWRRTGPVDDAELLGALFLAGPARLAELPPPAKSADKPESAFGWASLFLWYEKRHAIPSGRGWDHDIGQVLAEARVNAEAYDDLEE